jgi:hypothetical protein
MTKSPISLRDLRRRIYRKAKAEPAWRFWGLYVHVCKLETLREAMYLVEGIIERAAAMPGGIETDVKRSVR